MLRASPSAVKIPVNDYLLRNLKQMGLEGVVYLVGGETLGFALGFDLTETEGVAGTQKSRGYLPGLNEYIFVEIVRNVFPHALVINDCEDCGSPSLRVAKRKWYVREITEMWAATRQVGPEQIDRDVRRNEGPHRTSN